MLMLIFQVYRLNSFTFSFKKTFGLFGYHKMSTSTNNSGKILSHVDPGSLNYIIYHKDCPDGFGAAYTAWTQLGTNATYFAAAHGAERPSDSEIKGKRIGMFDYSYPKSIIKEIEEKAELLIIVDHHITAKEELSGKGDEKERNYHFDMNKSGARLAWEFFYPNKEVPLLIRHIEDNDLWRFALPSTKEFSAYWHNVPKEFETYDQYVKDEGMIKKVIESALYNIDVYILNSITMHSELGNALARIEDADFGLVWHYDAKEKEYVVSLRSLDEKADVSQIAKVFGGGGHRNASGFIWEGETIESLFDYDKTASEVWYM
ncbi:phosphoesterase [Rhizophagus clarus]|uniref:Phosphoesterase n=1 Tax=Rhizophagus clarus TaxID=94130 RepID=A0A8H3LII4_9GLOM|nr:phosphoesterase [Rhizophagus clarus]